MAASRTRYFAHEGQRLAYQESGGGDRPLVLLPGLLLPRRMHDPIARRLVDRGNRVLTLDFLAHGESDRAHGVGRYSTTAFARQVLGLLDHLEIDRAVVGGTSLGANVALETATVAPERLCGLVLEMPVLERGYVAGLLVFPPAMMAIRAGEPVLKRLAAVARRLPRGATALGDSLLSWAAQDPRAAADVLHGLLYGRAAPSRTERERIETPALVIAHTLDPLHALGDSLAAVRDLPNGRLLRARTALEMRFWPERLTAEVAAFLDEVWAPPARSSRQPRSARAAL